nr:immunoglobulin heavy chain junction region [Macaca mulatta]MOW75077.1 immunoglobulin heavy chain junction region [Macaca mulatta]MOW75096.1 immunoglobulin heavy chain junction region [Macaca mulatta]MOW75139.1 immunoglobulin heavy chain junction region [Macaca mulatta]MOW75179.1 immunoglobulin heavy chain junction region [Macaca mulatta]
CATDAYGSGIDYW